MQKLPRVCGDKHVAALKKAGWKLNHVEGSHHILTKEGTDVHLSIPVYKGKDLGITDDGYCMLIITNTIALHDPATAKLPGHNERLPACAYAPPSGRTHAHGCGPTTAPASASLTAPLCFNGDDVI